MFKTLLLTVIVQSSTPGDLLDYYNGASEPSYEEARVTVDENIKSPSSLYHEAVARYLSGYLYRKQGDVIKATIDYTECLSILDDVDTVDYYLEISVRKNLGAIWDDFRFYDLAIDYYNSAIPYAEAYSKKELASLYSNLGNSYRDKRDGENVIRAYFKALDISADIEDHNKVAQIYNKLGLSFYHANLNDTAEHYFYQAIYQRPHLSGKQLKTIGQAYHNLGQLQFNKGLTEDAVKSYITSLDYKVDNDRYVTLMDLGEIMIGLKRFDEARMFLTEARGLYPAGEAKTMEMHGVLKHMATLEYEMGNSNEAVALLKMYGSAVEDHLAKLDELSKMKDGLYFKQLVDSYNLDKQQNRVQNSLKWALICLGIALIFIIVPFAVIYADRKRVRRNLSEVEKDLTTLLD